MAPGSRGDRVTAVIPTLGRSPWLVPCLEALRRDAPEIEIVLIDQGETPVQTDLADKTIRPGRNLGFASATNLGIAASSREFVATVNDDAVVDERDMDVDEDGKVEASDRPKPCEGGIGPLKQPPAVLDRNDPRYHFQAVQQVAAAASALLSMASGYPVAFTNPFILDLNETAGFQGPKR